MSPRAALLVEIVAGVMLSLAGALWLFCSGLALLNAGLSSSFGEVVVCLWFSAPGAAMCILGVASLASLGSRLRARQVPEN